MVYEQDDQLLIRDMTAADPAIFDLEEQAQGWQPTLQKHLLRLSDQQAGRAIVLVAEIERQPVGYLSVYPGAKIREGEQRCELVDFGVKAKISDWNPGASEDFSFYTQKVPSVFMFLGSDAEGVKNAPNNHSDKFSPDESAMQAGVRAHIAAAMSPVDQ